MKFYIMSALVNVLEFPPCNTVFPFPIEDFKEPFSSDLGLARIPLVFLPVDGGLPIYNPRSTCIGKKVFVFFVF
jgi:hypothetical protein